MPFKCKITRIQTNYTKKQTATTVFHIYMFKAMNYQQLMLSFDQNTLIIKRIITSTNNKKNLDRGYDTAIRYKYVCNWVHVAVWQSNNAP